MFAQRSVTAALVIAAIAAPSPALATITPIVGGPGGREFKLLCPDDAIAVGVTANAGAWVDGLALLCSGKRRGARERTDRVGSGHSSLQEVYCPSGETVRAVSAMFTNGKGLDREFLNSVALRCSGESRPCISSGESCSYIPDGPSFGVGGLGRMSDELTCPQDEVLVGIVGRSGKYVDAIGAICGPMPGSSPAAQFNAPPAGSAVAPAYSPATTQLSQFGSGARSATTISSTAAPSAVEQPGQCHPGYVWREAGAEDRICVTPEGRTRVQSENALVASRIDPNSAYGPAGCLPGFVWREAFAGDLACVTPDSRSLAAGENGAHPQHRH